MFGYGAIPVAFVIRRLSGENKWWLREYVEPSNTCIWTESSLKAHIFTTESGCQDYIDKYLTTREVKIEEKVVHPMAYMYAG